MHVEPYGPQAGMAAVQAAKQGDLELHHVSFSYPLRPNTSGLPLLVPVCSWAVLIILIDLAAVVQQCSCYACKSCRVARFYP